MKPIYSKNYEAYLFCKICLDDWEDIWTLKELELYINAESPEDAYKKIIAYLDKKYLDFEVLFANVKKIREEN